MLLFLLQFFKKLKEYKVAAEVFFFPDVISSFRLVAHVQCNSPPLLCLSIKMQIRLSLYASPSNLTYILLKKIERQICSSIPTVIIRLIQSYAQHFGQWLLFFKVCYKVGLACVQTGITSEERRGCILLLTHSQIKLAL